uniref:putative F-box protein At1g47790 n=1 Tax=Erigeron canadensis TaxID=72917 RepID=UPI001CB8944C|nr:putative F-box protein At1g47790 [Erigeron canadensis]
MKRLPAKSLAVFRSVSKAWKSVIDRPLFIAYYTNFHQHHRLLIWNEVNIFESKYVSIMDNESLSQHTLTNVPAPLEQIENLSLIGTSKGLLCFSGYFQEVGCMKERAVVWNPSLGKSIAIDLPCHAIWLGFGVRCDPMIVLMNAVEHPYPAFVFTLSSRVWRVPCGNLPPNSIHSSYSPLVATDDRCIYWEVHDREHLVVAFDMVSEDFTEINLPHCVADLPFGAFSISKIRGSLALLEYCDDAKKPVYGVWMMAEDGVSKSFTKLFTINIPHTSLKPTVLGYRNNDQPFIETTTNDISASLEVYEPRTGTIKNLGINGECDSFHLSSYTETLLLLDQLDEEFVKISYDSDIDVESICDYIKSEFEPYL